MGDIETLAEVQLTEALFANSPLLMAFVFILILVILIIGLIGSFIQYLASRKSGTPVEWYYVENRQTAIGEG